MTGIRRIDAGWGPMPVTDVEPELFLELEPDPESTQSDVATLIELSPEPDPETDTFMMVDLVFDEETGPVEAGAPLAQIEPFVPESTTGAPRALSRPRSAKRWPLGRRRPRGPALSPSTPRAACTGARGGFPDALSDGDLASLIASCTEELCSY